MLMVGLLKLVFDDDALVGILFLRQNVHAELADARLDLLQLDADAEFVAQQFEVFRLGELAGEIERLVRPLAAEVEFF